MRAHARHPNNADGPFYTTGGCMACGAPEAEAPELFASLEGDNVDTYFIKQPTTPREIERACRAAEVCCVNAIRYGGHDPRILSRLRDSAEWCDRPRPWWRRLFDPRRARAT
jgi:ferredoxin